jgi:hypothetical protein
VGTEESAPGSTSIVTSIPYNCNHVKDLKFVDNIPCVAATLDGALVVLRVLVREAAVASRQ